MDLWELTSNDVDCIKAALKGTVAGAVTGVATIPFPVSGVNRDIDMMVRRRQYGEDEPEYRYAKWHQLAQRAGAYGHAIAIGIEAIFDGRIALAHITAVSVMAGCQILYNAIFDR